jgi:3-dehydroquinate dehydratase/shikimate dehydrogenase
VTLVCVPILVFDAAAAFREGRSARDLGADLVELRVDGLFHGTGEAAEQDLIVRLVSDSPLPCIVTCRPTWEGGLYDGPEDARIALFERLGTAFGSAGRTEHPPRYIDVEWAAYGRSANIRQKMRLAVEHPEQVRDLSTSLILSVHDSQGRPADLSRRLVAMRQERAARVLKVAYRARSVRDNLELLDLLEGRDRPMIALGMGEYGLMSRVLAPKFGGFLTFASLRPEAATAPGQPTIAELLRLYRFRSIGRETAVYGVVGDPVGHSLSPAVHNAGFEAVGHDGVYLPMPVPAGFEHLKATLLELIAHRRLGLRGLSVTRPHKEDLVRLALDQGWDLDEASRAAGVANTVAINQEGGEAHVRILNTDAAAMLEILEAATGPVRGQHIGILGAGGMARAAAWALGRAGAEVVIWNRAPERARRAAGSLPDPRPRIAARLEDLRDLTALVNCTPAGMAGHQGAGHWERDQPCQDDLLRNLPGLVARSPGVVVMDTVYTPARTALLREAGGAGLRTVDGVSMFVRQAAAQFQTWTGKQAPEDLFERIVRESVPDGGGGG